MRHEEFDLMESHARVERLEAQNRRWKDFPAHAVPNQAALQFYNQYGDVVWTAPSTPSVIQLK